MKTVQVTVHPSIIAKMKDAFTNVDNALSEAMQNARRAGASKVEFDINDKRVVITDDGHGISDMASFFTLAGSGWDEATIQRENAFGIGSFALLYACKHITVESGGDCIDIDTDELLGGQPIEVVQTDFMSGTRVTLSGFKQDVSSATRNLKMYSQGFAIPVYLNGEEILRPYALDSEVSTFHETDCGLLSDPDLDTLLRLIDGEDVKVHGALGDTLATYYYQGLPVAVPIPGKYAVFHVSESQFRVRMPDRACFIDQRRVLPVLEQAQRSLWLDLLAKAKQAMKPEDFVEKLYFTLRHWKATELLNDIDILPNGVVCQVVEEPYLERPYHDDVFTGSVKCTRADLEKNTSKLYELPTRCSEETIGIFEYAYRFDAYFAGDELRNLHKDHWVRDYIADHELEVTHGDGPSDVEGLIVIETVEAKDEPVVFTGWKPVYCYPCKTIKMHGPFGTIEIINSCIPFGGFMFIPSEAVTGWDIVKHLDYIDCHDDYQENDRERDIDQFRAFLIQLNQDFESAVREFLDYSNIRMLDVKGKSFTATFDVNGALSVSVH